MLAFPPFHPFCLSPFGPKGKRGGIGSTKKGEKGGKSGKLHQILRTTHQKWRGVRFKMGGAYLNFEVRLRGGIIILKI
jgi:hypothetical protein